MSVLWAYEQLVRVGVNAEGEGGVALFLIVRKFGGNYIQAHITLPSESHSGLFSFINMTSFFH